MNMKLSPVFFIILIMLSGCASHNYTDAPPTMGVLYSKYADVGYEGEIRSADDVGIVTTDGQIQVGSVDGRSMSLFRSFKTSGFYAGGRYQLHLLPGTHTITISLRDERANASVSWLTSSITKSITIDKGQVIHLAALQNGRTWSAKEFDGSSALAVIVSDFKELSSRK